MSYLLLPGPERMTEQPPAIRIQRLEGGHVMIPFRPGTLSLTGCNQRMEANAPRTAFLSSGVVLGHLRLMLLQMAERGSGASTPQYHIIGGAVQPMKDGAQVSDDSVLY